MNPRRTAVLFCVTVLVCGSLVFAETFGVKKRTVRPNEYGNVVINNFSEGQNVAPVVFPHWVHRMRYTCRLCHVDLGFAMTAGATGMREEEIRQGLYCGACHNGDDAFAGEEQGHGKAKSHCDRCHSYGKKVKFENRFAEATKGFPVARFGNRVDWLQAEKNGKIELIDEIPGITIKRRPLKDPEDIDLRAKEAGMPDIIFSHKKHAVWSGCELCHPEIFGVKKGATVYSMQDIFDGRYCGACHGKVAFPNTDCRLCHTKDVF